MSIDKLLESNLINIQEWTAARARNKTEQVGDVLMTEEGLLFIVHIPHSPKQNVGLDVMKGMNDPVVQTAARKYQDQMFRVNFRFHDDVLLSITAQDEGTYLGREVEPL